MNHNTVRVRNLLVAIAVFATAFCVLNGCSTGVGVTTTTTTTINASEDVATLCDEVLAIINEIDDGPAWPFTE